MNLPPIPSRSGLRSHLSEPMNQNAYWLMANTLTTSALGMAYWVVAARLFSDDATVGSANAMINAIALFSVFAQLSFGQALQRFLPRTRRHGPRFVLQLYGISFGASLVLSSLILVIVRALVDANYVLHVDLGAGVFLVVSVAIWTLFTLQDSVLIALREARWLFFENTAFAVVKLFTLGIAAAWFATSLGFVVSWMIPAAVATIPISMLIFGRFLPRHRRSSLPSEAPVGLRTIGPYVAGDYAGWISAQILVYSYPLLVPFLIPGLHGKSLAAYLSLALPVFTALNLLTNNLLSSFVVEAARDEAKTRLLARLVAKRLAVTVLPVALGIVVFAPLLLSLGGASYAEHASTLLRLLCLAVIPVATISLFVSLSRIQMRTSRVAMAQFGQAALVIGLAVLLVPKYELAGLGLAVVGGSSVVALLVMPSVLKSLGLISAR